MTPSWSTKAGREYRYYVCTKVERSGRSACPVRSVPAGTAEEFVVKHIRSIATAPALMTRVVAALHQQGAERVPALEAEEQRLEREHRQSREEARGLMAALGGDSARQNGLAAERLTELDQRVSQIARRLAEIQDELARIARSTVSLTQVQRALELFDPIWDVLLDRERYRILHLLLKRIEYDGEKGEIELQFHALGITRLAAEAAMVGQPDEEAA